MASAVLERAPHLQDGEPRVSGAVHIRGLVRRYKDNDVLDGLSLDIAPGEFVALLGRSGSGKTTLLRTLAALDRPTEGHLEVPQPRAVVFQEPRLLPWRRVWENVTLGLSLRDPRAKAAEILEEVGLAHRIDAWPSTLSGGEAQRAALARALVREPALLLLDEPFASLDALTRIKMYALVAALWRHHHPAVLLVTHDVEEAVLLADRALVLSNGQISACVPIDLDRPRNVLQPGFGALKGRLLKELGIVQLTPEAAELPTGLE